MAIGNRETGNTNKKKKETEDPTSQLSKEKEKKVFQEKNQKVAGSW